MATELETEVQAIDKSLLECSAEEIAAVRRARSARGGEAARLSGSRRGRAGRACSGRGAAGKSEALARRRRSCPAAARCRSALRGAAGSARCRVCLGGPQRPAPTGTGGRRPGYLTALLPAFRAADGRSAAWRLPAASPAAAFTRRAAVGGGGPLGAGALWY